MTEEDPIVVGARASKAACETMLDPYKVPDYPLYVKLVELADALVFYADPQNWEPANRWTTVSLTWRDQGAKAREALFQKEG